MTAAAAAASVAPAAMSVEQLVQRRELDAAQSAAQVKPAPRLQSERRHSCEALSLIHLGSVLIILPMSHFELNVRASRSALGQRVFRGQISYTNRKQLPAPGSASDHAD